MFTLVDTGGEATKGVILLQEDVCFPAQTWNSRTSCNQVVVLILSLEDILAEVKEFVLNVIWPLAGSITIFP